MHLSPADFAKLAGVNRVQVTKMVKARRLARGADGMLDTTSRKNAAYLEKHGVDASNLKDKPEVMLKRAEADTRVKNAQADWREMVIAEKRGQLVPQSAWRRWWVTLNAALKPAFLEQPKRLLPKLSALIRAGKDAEALALWQAENCDSLERILKLADDATQGEAHADG
jgi:hypothetical protein